MASSESFVSRPVSVPRAYEQLAGQLRARIVSGELEEGARLPSETALAEVAKVSRSTVREALRVLQEGGYVRRASPRIMVVGSLAPDRAARETTEALRRGDVAFRDLHEALLAIEPELTRLAALRAGPADVEVLTAQVEEQHAAAGDPEAWARLDDRFHVTIAEISGNLPLVLARRPISQMLLPTLWQFLRSESMADAAIDFHERIVEDIGANDPEGAAFHARRHVNDFRRAWERHGLDYDRKIGRLTGEPGATLTPEPLLAGGSP